MQKYLNTLLIVFATLGVNAQIANGLIDKHSIDLFFGNSNIHTNITSKGELPDLMNYLYFDDEYFMDDDYLNITNHIWWKGNWESELEIGLHSDLMPAIFKGSATYRFYKGFGIKGGITSYTLWLDGIHTFYEHLEDQYYFNNSSDLSYSSFQNNVRYSGPFAGLDYRYDGKRFSVEASVISGKLYTSSWDFRMAYKEKESNFRFKEEYNVQSSGSWFVKPELYLAYHLVDLNRLKIGLRARFSYTGFNKSFDYDYTKYEWVKPAVLNWEQKNFDKHWVEVSNIDFGVTLGFK